jgi:hypothetical protein
MLSKFFAAWLVVLVMVPFTAPFSAFSLSDLRWDAGQPTDPASSSAPAVAAAPSTPSHAVPIPRGTSRQRLWLTRLRLPNVAIIAPLAAHVCRHAPSFSDSQSATRSAVLRI